MRVSYPVTRDVLIKLTWANILLRSVRFMPSANANHVKFCGFRKVPRDLTFTSHYSSQRLLQLPALWDAPLCLKSSCKRPGTSQLIQCWTVILWWTSNLDHPQRKRSRLCIYRGANSVQNGVGAFILQCKRLDFHYCDWAGSSKGMK